MLARRMFEPTVDQYRVERKIDSRRELRNEEGLQVSVVGMLTQISCINVSTMYCMHCILALRASDSNLIATVGCLRYISIHIVEILQAAQRNGRIAAGGSGVE